MYSARISCSQSVMLVSRNMGETPRQLRGGFRLLPSTVASLLRQRKCHHQASNGLLTVANLFRFRRPARRGQAQVAAIIPVAARNSARSLRGSRRYRRSAFRRRTSLSSKVNESDPSSPCTENAADTRTIEP
jgi:hypothetical protein